MPHARFDVELHQRFQALPANQRPAAIALYWRAVLFSAELLLDGQISTAVLLALAPEAGIPARTEPGRSFPLAVANLVSIGLLNATASGGYTIVEWETHHSARGDVHRRRTRGAELKRQARAQLVLSDVHSHVRSGQTGMSEPDSPRARRAQADRTQRHTPKAVSEGTNGTGHLERLDPYTALDPNAHIDLTPDDEPEPSLD